jgi:hypothetical protein
MDSRGVALAVKEQKRLKVMVELDAGRATEREAAPVHTTVSERDELLFGPGIQPAAGGDGFVRAFNSKGCGILADAPTDFIPWRRRRCTVAGGQVINRARINITAQSCTLHRQIWR